MELQGIKMQGIKYRAVSPRDFAGLKLWLKPDLQNFEIRRGNSAYTWYDSSGNNRNWNVISSGMFINFNQYFNYYVNGGGDGNANFKSTTSDGYYDFLVNGAPYSVIVVGGNSSAFDTNGSVAGSTYLFGQSSSNIVVQSLINIAGPAASSNRIFFSATNPVNPHNQSLTPITTKRPGNALIHTCYGLGSTSPNSVIKQNGKTQEHLQLDYIQPPNPAYTMASGNNRLRIFFQRTVYEVIMYDHTGKTRNQIDKEMDLLCSNYFSANYPGISDGQADTFSLTTVLAKPGTGSVRAQFNTASSFQFFEADVSINYTLTYTKASVVTTITRTVTMPFQTPQFNSDITVPGGNAAVTDATLVINSITPNPVMGITINYPTTTLSATF